MADNHNRPASCHTERVVSGTTVVELRGEIDILTVLSLSARLDTLTTAPRPDLVLDLRPVSFIDCSGLGLLCRARKRVRAGHGRLRLITDSTSVLRLLRRTHLADAFEVLPRLPEPLLCASGADSLPTKAA